MLRHRLVSVGSEEVARFNLCISQTTDSELFLLQHAISSDKKLVALFTCFNNNKLINMLIAKTLDLILEINQ